MTEEAGILTIDEFESVKATPTRISLRNRYPQRLRVIIERSIWVVLILLVTLVGYLDFLNVTTFAGNSGVPDRVVGIVFDLLLGAVLIVCAIKIAYEFLYFMMYNYTIEREHLIISSGVLFRSRAAFPLAKINDISLQRSPIGLILGLYSLNVLTASAISQYGKIDGLSKKDAVDFQAFLLTLLETALPNINEEAAEIVLENNLPDKTADKIIHRDSSESLQRKERLAQSQNQISTNASSSQ